MNKYENLKQEIKDYFKIGMRITLEDSPQILDDYLYLEFEDATGSELKFRISYPMGKDAFVKMNKGDRMLFILTAVMRRNFGEY